MYLLFPFPCPKIDVQTLTLSYFVFFLYRFPVNLAPKLNILCHDDNAKIALSGQFLYELLTGKLNFTMMRYREIYKKTLKKWGKEAQYDQMIEECAELIATLRHFARDKVDKDAVVNELADVFLMVGQLTYMFGEDRLTAAVEKKIVKLQLLLDEGE